MDDCRRWQCSGRPGAGHQPLGKTVPAASALMQTTPSYRRLDTPDTGGWCRPPRLGKARHTTGSTGRRRGAAHNGERRKTEGRGTRRDDKERHDGTIRKDTTGR